MGKLTGRTAFSDTVAEADLLHLVDVSDTSQDPAGSSYKMTIAQLFGGRLTYGNVAFVTNYSGADTGIAGRVDRPFKTALAAQAAIGSGDSVIWMPGAYTEEGLGKNGVYYFAFAGMKNTSVNSTWTDAAGAISYYVDGFGEYETTGTGGGLVKMPVQITNASTINFNARKLLSANSGAAGTVLVTGGGKLYMNIQESIINSAGDAIRTGNSASEVYITCPKILSANASGLANQEAKVEINCSTISSTNATVLGHYAGANTKINGNVVGPGIIYNQSGGGECIINGSVTGDIVPANGGGGGSARIEINGVVTGKVTGHSNFTGKLILNKKITSNTAATPTIYWEGGDLFPCDQVINSDNNAASHCITWVGGTIALDGTVLIATHASAEGIYSAAPVNVFVFKNSVGNRALNGNVTIVGGGSYGYDNALTYPQK